MIEQCAGCNKKHDDFKWLRNEEGWWCHKWYKRGGMSDKMMEEYIATPFWKITGQKPKPQELAQEKWMKDHNMTYSDVRKKQIADSPVKYDPSPLREKIKKGEFTDGQPRPKYRKKKL